MTHFIQLHLLTSYAASNLNRDDTGRPKTLHFGGAERLRISSQSLKRAFRTSDVFQAQLPEALGKRSISFADGLIRALVARGLDEAEATKRAAAVIEHDKLGKLKKDKDHTLAKTEQLVHLGPDELAALEQLADRLAVTATLDDKEMLVLQRQPRAVDIAMFGRMLADNPGYNVEAAVQVAHALTTHRVTVEDDFYTAVDDFKNADGDADRGAGFLGVQEYGAGLFYLYICINADLLLANLAGDRALAGQALAGLIKAAATVSPTGKQNAFASRAFARCVVQEIGTDTPRSLAAAFERPVGQQPAESDLFEASVKRLEDLRTQFNRIYDQSPETHVLKVGADATASLADLVAAAQGVLHRIQTA
jgi:CRISPR system Cascade subunit CasC